MIGQTISHYRIEKKLGEGGMGAVYKAEDTLLRRPVALKFLSQKALGSGTAQARFQREAQAAGSLDHPNICTVYGFESHAEHHFIVMAYIPGEGLDRLIASRDFTLGQALDIAVQIGEGLKEAHDKGIVHRDVKSANIMVTPERHAVITDFGLAQLSDRSRITETGTTLGTMVYMSPEQALGKRVDRRTDVWGLGVVLYEMLTGEYPFQGKTIHAVCRSILKDTPRRVTEHCRDLPDDACWIISKALAKKPDERYQHVDDFVVDLRALRKSVPEDVTVPSRGAAKNRDAVSPEARTMTLVDGNHVTIDTSLDLSGTGDPQPRVGSAAQLGSGRWKWILAAVAVLLVAGMAVVWWRSLTP
jgi:serine/threonine-protein kinase